MVRLHGDTFLTFFQGDFLSGKRGLLETLLFSFWILPAGNLPLAQGFFQLAMFDYRRVAIDCSNHKNLHVFFVEQSNI